MAYNNSYDEGDIGTSVLSTLTKALLTVGTLITVIVVIYLYAWMKKNWKG